MWNADKRRQSDQQAGTAEAARIINRQRRMLQINEEAIKAGVLGQLRNLCIRHKSDPESLRRHS